MPFYGGFDHLRAAVESVLAQRDPDWRLVVIDDVYPDLAPGEWVRSIDDARVEYIRNEENLRPSRNYRKAVSLARTPHMVMMGCDDVMLPDYVGRIRGLLARYPGVDIVQPGVEVIDQDGSVHRPIGDRVKSVLRPGGTGPRELSGERLARSLLGGNWTYFPSLVWRTEALGRHGFRVDLDVVQDLAMLLDITLDGGRMVVDDDVVFAYRRHSTSVSAVTGPDGTKFAQERELFEEFEARCTQLGWDRAAGAARRHWSSRLSAVTELPAALRARDAAGRESLLRHVFGR